MDILIPIALGIAINLLVFTISKLLKQTHKKSLLICLIAFLIVLIASFFIGSWIGMGIGVISFGMLIFVILSSIYIAISPRKNNVIE